MESIDVRISKDVPTTALLVAHARTPEAPLVFQTPSEGHVLYVANGDMVAAVSVREGYVVELNAFLPGKMGTSPWTELKVNEKDVVYRSPFTRAGDNRLYFLAR